MYIGQKGIIQPAISAVIPLVPVPRELSLKVQSIDRPDDGLHKTLDTMHRVLHPHEHLPGGDDAAAPLTAAHARGARELRLIEEARASQEIAEDLEKIGAFLRIIPTLKVVGEPMGVGTNLETAAAGSAKSPRWRSRRGRRASSRAIKRRATREPAGSPSVTRGTAS